MDHLTYLMSAQRTAELRAEAAHRRLARSVASRPSLLQRTSAVLAERLRVVRASRPTAACATC